MPAPELSAPECLARLERLSEAFIDASSMIVCNKAGFLDIAAESCALYTIQPVLDETGYRDAPVSIRPAAGGSGQSDDLLLAAAVDARLPLISEDRALLLRFAASGLDYYNALMLLNLLLLQRRISPRDYGEHARLLRGATRYSTEVQARAEAVYLEIIKRY